MDSFDDQEKTLKGEKRVLDKGVDKPFPTRRKSEDSNESFVNTSCGMPEMIALRPGTPLALSFPHLVKADWPN